MKVNVCFKSSSKSRQSLYVFAICALPPHLYKCLTNEVLKAGEIHGEVNVSRREIGWLFISLSDWYAKNEEDLKATPEEKWEFLATLKILFRLVELSKKHSFTFSTHNREESTSCQNS